MNWMRWKLVLDRLGERLHRERLREAGHALEQHVAAGEQPDEQPLDHVVLADDAAGDLFEDRLDERRVRGRHASPCGQEFAPVVA